MWTIYRVRRGASDIISPALAEGSNLPMVDMPTALQPGNLISYGDGAGMQSLINQAQQEGREWVYIDRGYFKARHYDGYYRVTHNAYQLQRVGAYPSTRFDALGLEIRPWRKEGKHILVCPPSPHLASMVGLDSKAWLQKTLQTLRRYTKREIIVRHKAPPGWRELHPIEKVLEGAHALVTYASNAAIDALLMGIPIFMTSARGAAFAYSQADLTWIENPRFPEGREQLMYSLAANQWTVEEMKNGTCWRQLQENQF